MANFATPQSAPINGQLIGMMENDAWEPSVIGPVLQQGTSPAPSAPPVALGQLQGMPTSGGASAADALTAQAANSPWDPRVSPLLFVILALVIGYLGLRYVHWRM